jgi:phytoene synthase
MKEIMEEYSTTFFECMDAWPDELKKDIYKLYAYLRVCDEMVETEKELHDFAHWREVIEQFYKVSDKYQFKGEWLADFHLAMYTDLIKKEHTVTSMLEYCKGSAESVGMMMATILGCDPRAERHARALGRAYQIINFVRDYDEDVANGFHYITDDFKLYIKLFMEDLQIGVEGLQYIPEELRGPILLANQSYLEVAHETQLLQGDVA